MVTIFVYVCFIMGVVDLAKMFVKFVKFIAQNLNLAINNQKGINKKQYIQKSINFDPVLIKQVEELAEESERSFSKQVKFMLKKYIETTENE